MDLAVRCSFAQFFCCHALPFSYPHACFVSFTDLNIFRCRTEHQNKLKVKHVPNKKGQKRRTNKQNGIIPRNAVIFPDDEQRVSNHLQKT